MGYFRQLCPAPERLRSRGTVREGDQRIPLSEAQAFGGPSMTCLSKPVCLVAESRTHGVPSGRTAYRITTSCCTRRWVPAERR